MPRRSAISRTTAGGLSTFAVIAAAVLGVLGMPTSTPATADTVHGNPRAAGQLWAVVKRTLRASSLSEGLIISQSSGPRYEKMVYNAPDRLETVNSSMQQPLIIAVGASEYALNPSGSGWSETEKRRSGTEKTAALGYLSLALRSSTVHRSGRSFTAVIFYHGSPSQKDRDEAIATIRTAGGFVSEESLVIRSSDRLWPGETMTIKFSDIDASPKVLIPSAVSNRPGEVKRGPRGANRHPQRKGLALRHPNLRPDGRPPCCRDPQ